MHSRFNAFLGVAFISNLAGSAYLTATGWVIGSPTLPAWFPLVNQVWWLFGMVLGARLGAILARRVDYGVGAAWCATLEGLLFLVGATVLTLPGVASSGKTLAVSLTVVSTLASLATAVGGPLWMAIVYSWPDPMTEVDARIMRESAVFQLARTLGPLLGGAALLLGSAGTSNNRGAEASTAQVLMVMNGLSFLLVAGFLRFGMRGSSFGRDTSPDGNIQDGTRHRLRLTTPLTVIVAMAASFDAARTYVPRLARTAGLDEAGVAAIFAVLSLGAAIAGFALGRATAHYSGAARARAGTWLTSGAVALWLAASLISGPGSLAAWLLGALAGGIGLSLVMSAATRWHIDQRGAAGRGSAEVSVARSVSSTSGGLLVAGMLTLSLPALLPSLVIAGSAAALLTVRQRSSASDQV